MAVAWETVARIGTTIAVSALAGFAANWLTLPLPWLIGPMLCITVAALSGARPHMPTWLARLLAPVLGVWLGSAFSPALIGQIPQWLPSIVGLLCWMVAACALGYVYFRRVAGFDRITALFSATPGGMADMTLIGTAMGGDARLITLCHSARIAITVLAIPFWFRFVYGLPPARATGPATPDALDPTDLGILAACAVAGVVVARRLRLPAADVMGPMILSAIIHATGLTQSRPPAELVAIAQVLLGAGMGARFVGVSFVQVGRTLRHAAIETLMIIGAALVTAEVVHEVSGLALPLLVLVYAPGGLTEMSLIAFALGIDPAFVALHHMLRITAVILVAPLIYRAMLRKPKV